MVQAFELLFSSNKSNQIFFNEKTNVKKEVSTSGYSFEEVLNNSRKRLKSSQEAIEKNTFSKKEKQEELEDEIDQVFSTLASKEMFIEWLMALITGRNGESAIAADDLFESIKTIAPSIQDAMAQQPLSSASIMNSIQAAFESLLSNEMDAETDNGAFILNNIGKVFKSLLLNEMEMGTESLLIKGAGENGDIRDALLTEMAGNLSLEEGTSYDSSIKWMIDDIPEHVGVQPKQIMELMQMAGLGKQISVSSTDMEAAIDNAVKQNTTDESLKIRNSDINLTNEISSEIGGIEGAEGNNFDNFNSLDNTFSSSEALDSTSIASFKTSADSQILDFIKILDKNNPTGNIEIIRELAEKISMNLKGNRYEMELQVKPEYLGKLILKVTLEDGVLSGKIYTTSQRTGDILQNNLEILKNALEEQGYAFSQLDVNVGNEEYTGQFQYPEREQTNIRRSNLAVNSFDEIIEDQSNVESNIMNNYMYSSAIDYFA